MPTHTKTLPTPEAEELANRLQDEIVRTILAKMGEKRMNARMLCQLVGISQAHFSEIRNLKSTLSLDKLCRINRALGITMVFNVVEHGTEQ